MLNTDNLLSYLRYGHHDEAQSLHRGPDACSSKYCAVSPAHVLATLQLGPATNQLQASPPVLMIIAGVLHFIPAGVSNQVCARGKCTLQARRMPDTVSRTHLAESFCFQSASGTISAACTAMSQGQSVFLHGPSIHPDAYLVLHPRHEWWRVSTFCMGRFWGSEKVTRQGLR